MFMAATVGRVSVICGFATCGMFEVGIDTAGGAGGAGMFSVHERTNSP